jgi:hypothetical protein
LYRDLKERSSHEICYRDLVQEVLPRDFSKKSCPEVLPRDFLKRLVQRERELIYRVLDLVKRAEIWLKDLVYRELEQ